MFSNRFFILLKYQYFKILDIEYNIKDTKYNIILILIIIQMYLC